MRVEIEHYRGFILTIYDDWTYDWLEDADTDYLNAEIKKIINDNKNSVGRVPGPNYGIDEDGFEVLGETHEQHSTEYKMRTIARKLMRGRFVDFTIYDES